MRPAPPPKGPSVPCKDCDSGWLRVPNPKQPDLPKHLWGYKVCETCDGKGRIKLVKTATGW